jgi:type II secretory pathway pseudopilin PulG
MDILTFEPIECCKFHIRQSSAHCDLVGYTLVLKYDPISYSEPRPSAVYLHGVGLSKFTSAKGCEMRQLRRHFAGLTTLELLVVISIIVFLIAFLFAATLHMRERTRVSQSKKVVESVHNALEAYNMEFRGYPPDSFAGYSSAEALVYFLTTSFRIAPDTSKGEVAASINGGPYGRFNEVELKQVSAGKKTLIDAWGTPIQYKLQVTTEVDVWDATKNRQSYVVKLYSCGSNKIDDGGGGDDLEVGR